jgi:hypothetical protein
MVSKWPSGNSAQRHTHTQHAKSESTIESSTLARPLDTVIQEVWHPHRRASDTIPRVSTPPECEHPQVSTLPRVPTLPGVSTLPGAQTCDRTLVLQGCRNPGGEATLHASREHPSRREWHTHKEECTRATVHMGAIATVHMGAIATVSLAWTPRRCRWARQPIPNTQPHSVVKYTHSVPHLSCCGS